MVHIFSRLVASVGQIRMAAAPFALALLLSGCASVPPPDDSMNMAQTQLQAARDAGAADYAPVDLGFAQDKFQQAQTAMNQRDYAVASDLAAESRADAELARSKALLAAARAKIQTQVQQNSELRAQGEAAQADADRLSQQMAQPAPAPASSSTAPSGDMPAPDSSVLSSPAPAEGFQTIPANNQPASQDSQGEQP